MKKKSNKRTDTLSTRASMSKQSIDFSKIDISKVEEYM